MNCSTDTALNASATPTAQRTPKQQPSDVPAWAGLSFIKWEPTRHGREVSDWFAVPLESYEDGWVTGLLAFQELQRFLKANPGGNFSQMHLVEQVFCAAYEACESGKIGEKCKRGAAKAFARCAAEFATAMMIQDTGAGVARMIEREDKARLIFHAVIAEERAAFVERMRAAREAKRAARQALAIAGASH